MGALGGIAVAGTTDFVFLALGNCQLLGQLLAQNVLAQTADPSWIETVVSSVWVWARVAMGIGFVIFVHELGHFLAAKWCGVKVEKFYVGFDAPIKIGPIQFPRTLAKFRYGETEYGIGTIPLGGYVKMLGQDDDPRKAEAEANRIRQAAAPGENPEQMKLDPRSFPAKPVWQRMVIISAGVVMNVITGVMFAAVAFFLGVPYAPAIVGDLTPGSPAYQAGVEPGGKVVTVGHIQSDDQLSFMDMKVAILTEGLNNPDEPVNIALEYPDGIRDYKLMTTPTSQDPSQRMIGIAMPPATKLMPGEPASPGSVAGTVMTDKEAGATILAIDGIELPGGTDDEQVASAIALRTHLQANVAKPVELTLRRADDSETKITLPPEMWKLPGLRFSVGAVTALVNGGVADTAGVLVGDRLVAVDGDRLIDALSLPIELANASQTTTMTFMRGDGEAAKEVEISLSPASKQKATSAISEIDSVVSLGRFDFTYRISPIVAAAESVGPDNADAIQAGDVLKSVAVRWPGGVIPKVFEGRQNAETRTMLTEGYELKDSQPLVSLLNLLQYLPVETELVLMLSRNDKIVEAKANLVTSAIPAVDRGLRFDSIERIHYAAGLGDAASLGLREARRRMGDVFGFLQLALKGKVQAKQVGGPITIFRVAGAETTRGWSRLLMFLTMLSMNLAILNFLPIPVLDGGHMVFLTAEAVMGKPVNEKLQFVLTLAGFAMLLSLMFFAIVNDIRHL